MVISALKQQQKDPNRVSVYVDGKYSFSLTLDQVVELRIRAGQEVDKSSIEHFTMLSYAEKLRLKALNWITLRPRAFRELDEYLYRQKRVYTMLEPSAFAEVREYVRKKGWVDDRRYAEWSVARRSRMRKSTHFLRAELSSKGVPRDVVADVLSSRTDTEALRIEVEKLRSRGRQMEREVMIRRLMAKGYRYSAVVDALDGVEDNEF